MDYSLYINFISLSFDPAFVGHAFPLFYFVARVSLLKEFF